MSTSDATVCVTRVERLPNASHWVHHDEHEHVNQLLTDFFASARGTSND